ncbi:pyridoxal phosphate-dependent aminotransferase [Nitrosopumilus piranensis]|uniref:Aminotransferase n=1 Tax=Nitrosopumilus piranensis TaxID=1582439 RepID=A0A0C5BU11_9ARCH|nr:pyridoxal phosphate-dependent aminotransferase [Nitrosopumilus piranensis]AJM91771.1 Aminotransferase class I and II [Nitrosopumilus piranensis]
MFQIQVEDHIDKVVMPDNLKVGLMVAEQREKCASGGCTGEFYGLGFGQSPFHVPPVLENALSENSDKGHYSAAEGILKLRQAIAGFNKRHFDLDVDPARIVIGPGTKDIINTLFGIIKGGVILPSPSWIGYRPQIHLLNKHFHTFYLKPEHDYKINSKEFEEFVSKLSGKQHTLVLNNPHNPTGALYTKDELEELANVCRRKNILVLADEIYALDSYDVSKFTSMAKVYPEGTFVTNGLSKDRSAGGYRLGSCILPMTSCKKLASDYKKVAATVYTNVSTPIQYAAIKAYEQNDEIEDYISTTRQIHQIMGEYLYQQWDALDGISTTKPEGAFYFFADFNSLSENLRKKGVNTSNQLAESLLSCPFHIAVVTGDACMLKPDNFGARVAFVDYDGKKTFDDYKDKPPQNDSEKLEFVKRNAPLMVRSVDSLKQWISYIKSD